MLGYMKMQMKYMYREVDKEMRKIDVKKMKEEEKRIGEGWGSIMLKVIFKNVI